MAAERIEVLAPAGDAERLTMALTYGADAVYLAGKAFGMRAASGNFDRDGLAQAKKLCTQYGAKMYVTCNAIPRNDELAQLPPFLEYLDSIGADAVIAADVGVLSAVKKYAPHAAVHISTQAGILNYETARAFCDMGADRVILARELTLDEIAEIRAKTPASLQLEAFVHGSMCVSFSGRCLLSNYLAGRDANRGMCAQPCRWKYHLVEEKRPGEYLEISEDGGTYILNSRDMCMIDHIPELIRAGVCSAKIEGRMKSAYYAAVITNAYRHAADAAADDLPLSDVWRRETDCVSHREYTTGFYFSKSGPGQYYHDSMYTSSRDIAAVVEQCGSDGEACLTQRNKFSAGDALELLCPDGEPIGFTAAGMKNTEGESIDSTPHPMMEFSMRLPRACPQHSLVRKIK